MNIVLVVQEQWVKKKFKMKKTTIVTILYILGIIFGAIVVGIWDAETNISRALFALLWTTIFLIALFYVDKKND